MPVNNGETVLIEDAELIFRNFSGRPDKYTREGELSFGVILPEPIAVAMADDGWNIKRLKPHEDDEDQTRTPWLQVKVRYDARRPPTIVLITSRGRTILSESDVYTVDAVDIAKADLIVRAWNWSQPSGESGVAAYLKSLYVTVEEDDLAKKYGDLPMQNTPRSEPA